MTEIDDEIRRLESRLVVLRAKKSEHRVPDGLDGIRDIDAPCEEFKNGSPSGDCQSDGHYLCRECRHYDGGVHLSRSEVFRDGAWWFGCEKVDCAGEGPFRTDIEAKDARANHDERGRE